MSINTKKESQCGAGKLPIPKIFKGKKGTKKGKKQSPERPQSFTEFLGESRNGQALLEELRRAERMEPERFGTFGYNQSTESPKSLESPKSMKRARVSSSPNGPTKKRKVGKPTLAEKPKLGQKKRMTSANTERIAGELRDALAKFYAEKGQKSPGSRSSMSSNNSSLWNQSSVGSSLSSVESFRRRSSSPKAKKGSKRVKFRSRDSVKTQSRYQQKRTNSNERAYNSNRDKRRVLELKQFKKEINSNRKRFGNDFANEVNALDMASVNFGIEFQSVKYRLREDELREFKSKYPELFKK